MLFQLVSLQCNDVFKEEALQSVTHIAILCHHIRTLEAQTSMVSILHRMMQCIVRKTHISLLRPRTTQWINYNWVNRVVTGSTES